MSGHDARYQSVLDALADIEDHANALVCGLTVLRRGEQFRIWGPGGRPMGDPDRFLPYLDAAERIVAIVRETDGEHA